jgi:hypothetical protein
MFCGLSKDYNHHNPCYIIEIVDGQLRWVREELLEGFAREARRPTMVVGSLLQPDLLDFLLLVDHRVTALETLLP